MTDFELYEYSENKLKEKEKQIKELERRLEETEKELAEYQFNYPTIKELSEENAELKKQNEKLLESCEGATMMYKHLTKAKNIIKDYKIVVEGGHIEVCGVPEENRTIFVLELNEQAEQFLKGNGE
jgi:DNA repair exonuclease SbcCD ATPase subunit